jgi:hypothetical protein
MSTSSPRVFETLRESEKTMTSLCFSAAEWEDGVTP